MDVRPSDLIALGDEALAASQALGGAWSRALEGLQLGGTPAGNVTGADALVAAHGRAADAADVALGHLVDTLEQNMDDLYAVAFDLGTTDEEVAATYETTHPRPAPAEPGPAPTPFPTPAGP